MGSQPSTQATPRRGIAREGRSLRTLRRVSEALRHRAERPPGGGKALRVPALGAPLWGGPAFPACAHWPAIAGSPAPASFPTPTAPGGQILVSLTLSLPLALLSRRKSLECCSHSGPRHIITTPTCSLARTLLDPHVAVFVVSVLWAPGFPV